MSDNTNGSTPNGRAINGQFQKGNAFARGNPGYRKMVELRSAMLDAATPEILTELTKRLAADALKGDNIAARLFLEYCVGKPVQAIELSGPDGERIGLDIGKLQGLILAALEPFGSDAKIAVAMALRGAALGRPD